MISNQIYLNFEIIMILNDLAQQILDHAKMTTLTTR